MMKPTAPTRFPRASILDERTIFNPPPLRVEVKARALTEVLPRPAFQAKPKAQAEAPVASQGDVSSASSPRWYQRIGLRRGKKTH